MSKLDYREILRLDALGMSRRRIAGSMMCSRDPVSRVLDRAKETGLRWEEAERMTPEEVELSLYPERKVRGDHVQPDCEWIHEELAKPGVTLTLLHREYTEKCREDGRLPYQYTQFCHVYRQYARRAKATLRIVHKPGVSAEMDWAGDIIRFLVPETGAEHRAFLFVSCLPCSQLFYAEAFPDMKSESWITANVHALEYFGGVPEMLVPDNLKTGIISHTRSKVVVAHSYRDMAEYYGTVIVPARVYRPKDKASVEKTVSICETWIIARLRSEKFSNLRELNSRIRTLLEELNARPFQKKSGSRRSTFEAEEKAYLRPLPEIPYEVPEWKKITVQPDYLVEAGGCKYSVPYGYIGCRVDVRIRRETVDVFFENLVIASHVRREAGSDPVYIPEHMPENHRRAVTFTEDSCTQWASGAGGNICLVMQSVLGSPGPSRIRIQSARTLMRLADKYSLERLEKACSLALSASRDPSPDTIEAILRNGRENTDPVYERVPEPHTSGKHSLTRGAVYYSRRPNR